MTESTAPAPRTMPTVDLASYVQSHGREAGLVGQLTEAASAMVAQHIGQAEVPDAVLSQAILAVGANLYQKRNSATGTGSFGEAELVGNPMRPALDPLAQAYPLLARWTGPAIA